MHRLDDEGKNWSGAFTETNATNKMCVHWGWTCNIGIWIEPQCSVRNMQIGLSKDYRILCCVVYGRVLIIYVSAFIDLPFQMFNNVFVCSTAILPYAWPVIMETQQMVKLNRNFNCSGENVKTDETSRRREGPLDKGVLNARPKRPNILITKVNSS